MGRCQDTPPSKSDTSILALKISLVLAVATFVVLIRCTAVIVSEEWVLGAAHCYFNHDTEVSPRDINIVTGIVDLNNQTDLIHRQERRASRIIVHSQFKEKKLGQNDVALVQLETPLHFDNHTQAIPLSEVPFPRHQWKLCTVVGWGDIEENVTATHLVKLDVSASHSRDACHGLSDAQLASLICVPEQVNGGGLCDGDSGGPLVCDGKLVGISHQVYKEIFSDKDSLSLECGMQDMVHTFMFMCKYLPWMKNYIDQTPDPPHSCFVAMKGNT
uniref:Trypsin-21 n=1 Tax=Nilaparvata lugens TaxID=108931 RepID=A0A068F7B5_NILLU|nr:trypsin-21 [Nilaparvata lugens]